MLKYLLKISYDGTNFCGWQSQKNGRSIQEAIEEVLLILLKKKTKVVGSGRTDAGVHAIGQVAHFEATALNTFKFLNSLNALLPKEIRILKLEKVDPNFHARYSAKSKTYEYRISLKEPLPFDRLYCHYSPILDIAIIRKGAHFLQNSHDFTSFINLHSSSKQPMRTIKRIEVIEEENFIKLQFEADGFLYKMVRNLVGVLLQLGSKKIDLKELEEILNAKDRKKAPEPAPAKGLFLLKVEYH